MSMIDNLKLSFDWSKEAKGTEQYYPISNCPDPYKDRRVLAVVSELIKKSFATTVE